MRSHYVGPSIPSFAHFLAGYLDRGFYFCHELLESWGPRYNPATTVPSAWPLHHRPLPLEWVDRATGHRQLKGQKLQYGKYREIHLTTHTGVDKYPKLGHSAFILPVVFHSPSSVHTVRIHYFIITGTTLTQLCFKSNSTQSQRETNPKLAGMTKRLRWHELVIFNHMTIHLSSVADPENLTSEGHTFIVSLELFFHTVLLSIRGL